MCVHCSSGNMALISLRTSETVASAIPLRAKCNINQLIFSDIVFIFCAKNTVFGLNVFHCEKLVSLDSAIVELRGRVVSRLTSDCGGTWFDCRPLNQLFWLRNFVFFLSHSRKILNMFLKQAVTDSFYILSNLSVTIISPTQHYITYAVENASLYKGKNKRIPLVYCSQRGYDNIDCSGHS
jgi:hypothetical protein